MLLQLRGAAERFELVPRRSRSALKLTEASRYSHSASTIRARLRSTARMGLFSDLGKVDRSLTDGVASTPPVMANLRLNSPLLARVCQFHGSLRLMVVTFFVSDLAALSHFRNPNMFSLNCKRGFKTR